MVVQLNLTNGQTVYADLNLWDADRDALVVLQDIFEKHPTGWIGVSYTSALTGEASLVSIAQIVTAAPVE